MALKKAVPIGAAAAAVAFGVFVALAQTQAIHVPYFTPTKIEFRGLEEQYPVNGSMNYEISLKGFGSNCIAFEAEMVREDGERAAYYNQIQDCRTIEISEGPYNYTRSFSYIGDVVLGEPGSYHVNVRASDQITGQQSISSQSFIVVEEST
jgi:hypothetical protein